MMCDISHSLSEKVKKNIVLLPFFKFYFKYKVTLCPKARGRETISHREVLMMNVDEET